MEKKKKFDISKFATGRVAVFIDAANILYSQQTMKWDLDYKKLSKYLRKHLNIVFVGFYHGSLRDSKGQREFFQILEDNEYTLRTKPVKYIKVDGGEILKGNLDIEIAFDILTTLDTFDTCILMSGDSDFEIILRYLKKKGKKVVVVSTKGHVSYEIIRASHKYIDLKRLKLELSREKNKQKNTPEHKSTRG